MILTAVLFAATMVASAERAPTMGWSSWNAFGADVTEEVVLAQAEAMATNGLREAGFKYVNIDDGAFHGRDEQGFVRPNEKRFPNGFKGITKRIHELGLKAGTYSDAGEGTCSGLHNGDTWGLGTGFYGHEEQDCRQRFLDWGFDFVKIDFCGGRKLQLLPSEQYGKIRKAIDATGRKDVVMNICCWHYNGAWVREVGDSWRIGGDIRANWKSLKKMITRGIYLSPYGGFGHYNDLDMMQVGRLVGKTKPARYAEFKSDTGLTEEEEQTHFGLWCIFESPLLIGCDLRELPASSLKLLTNPELIAMNQAEPHEQAYIVWERDGTYCFVKDADRRFGQSRYVALYNSTDSEQKMKLEFSEVDLGGKVRLRDLVRREDAGARDGSMEVAVPPHGTRFYRLTAEQRLDRSVYEAELAYLNEFSSNPPNFAVEASQKAGQPQDYARRAERKNASGGNVVRFLGQRESNYLEWRDVHVSRDGVYSLEFDYTCGDDRIVDVQIDEGPKVELQTPVARDGGTVQLVAELAAGSHTVRLSRVGAWAADFDRMRLSPYVEEAVPLTFERIQFKNFMPAYPNAAEDPNAPVTFMRVMADRPVLGGELQSAQPALDAWLARLLANDPSPDANLQDSLMKAGQRWFENYRKKAAGFKDRSEFSDMALSNWFADLKGTVSFSDNTYICYEVVLNKCTGGDQPDARVRLGVWLLPEGRQLTVDDIFGTEGAAKLLQLVKAEAVAQGAKVTKLTENFSIDDGGVSFLFNPGEVAPKESGFINVMIDWGRLQDFVQMPIPQLPVCE